MIEASGEEGDSDEEKEETEPQAAAECPAHKTAIKTAKRVMTDKEVYTNAAGFLIAGNETTSILLAYASYLLALNPDVQEKLQSEIDAYFEDKPVNLRTSLYSMILSTMHNIVIAHRQAYSKLVMECF